MSTFSFGQVDDFTIYGESLWRNQGYGVENHSFQIENYVIPEMDSWYVPSDPFTDECPYEIYTTDFMPLYTVDYNAYANTLKIRPYSVNNAGDYRNGVNVLDSYAVNAHLLGSPLFEARTPTEDFPFRYISADVDYDNDVDEDDIDMIQELILYYRDDLERNSWEWVHKDEVEEAEERFEEVPYEFVIDYNWPGSEGIILPYLSTNQIMGDNDKYFTFRTTKVGDIMGSAMSPGSSNSWVCGSGVYLTGGDISTRSSGAGTQEKLRSGSVVTVGVLFDNEEDIHALEIPIYFSDRDYKVQEVNFTDQYSPKWHRNAEKGSLVILDMSKDLKKLTVPRGKLVELKLEARHDISDVTASITWLPSRSVIVLGANEEILDPQVAIEILDILPGSLYAEVRSFGNSAELMLESPMDQQVHKKVVNYQGQIVHEEDLIISRGQNIQELPSNLMPGMYMCIVEGQYQRSVIKWINP